jgi:mono/diheme cytochrome c family protein
MDRRAALLLLVVIALGAAWGYTRGGGPADPAPPVAAATATAPPASEVSATPEPPTGSPRAVFAHACGMCHALADAGTAGVTGPDLDALRPSAARVRRMIRTGSLDGVMQPDLVRGAQAAAVARYVARAARD